MGCQRAEWALRLDGLNAALAFFSRCLGDANPDQENLWVAHLDTNSYCLHLTRHVGDDSSVDFPLRSIIVDAALHGTSAILLAHNHPSGNAAPSDQDRRATRRLACAAEAIDCTVVDHLVFGGGHCTSFRQLGLL